MKYLYLILFIIMFGCADIEDSGKDANQPIADDTGIVSGDYVKMEGYSQDGPCLAGGSVQILPLDSTDLAQSGDYYNARTLGDFGYYIMEGKVTNQYFELIANLACHNEVTGAIMSFKELRALVDVNSSERNNINPATTATIKGIRFLYRKQTPTLGYNTYQNFTLSKRIAETFFKENLFNAFGIEGSFTDMSIDSTGDANAFLLAANITLLEGKSVAEQTELLEDIGDDLLDGVIDDPNVISEIQTGSQNIQLVQVKNNVKNRYTELGQDITVPAFWNFLDSDGDGSLNKDDADSFVELMERIPTLRRTLNLDDTCSASFDTNGFNWFAIPFRFDSSITLSNYIGLNLEGDISIYTRTFDVYDKPGTLVFTPTKIKDNFFQGEFEDTTGDTYSNLPYGFHGSLAGHNLVPGTDYYIVIRREESWRLSKSCSGPLTVFGRVLASMDGVDWIGFDNSTPFFRRQGIKMFLTD